MVKIVYLPQDASSLNFGFTDVLYDKSKEITLSCPKGEILSFGDFPADFGKIEKYLNEACKTADYLVVSTDVLLYGGIDFSRKHYLSKTELKRRLLLLENLKKGNENLKIYAYSTIMRAPCYNTTDVEQEYYGICGEELFLYGQNEHLRRHKAIKCKAYRLNKRVLLPICKPYLKDYENRRKVNLSMLIKTVSLLKSCVDRLLIVKDVTVPYGYYGSDCEKLGKYTEKYKDKIDFIPSDAGAGVSLISRIILKERGESFGVCPIYADSGDANLEKTVKKCVESVGATVCDEKNAEVLLFCNVKPSKEEVVLDLVGARNYQDFVYKMKKSLEDKKKVAIADDYLGDGGDIELVKSVSEKFGIFKVSGYSGRDDFVGSVIESLAESVLFLSEGNVKSHRKRIATRVYDDIGINLAKKGSDEYGKGKKTVSGKAVLKTASETIEKEVAEVFERYSLEQIKTISSSPFKTDFTVTERVDK